ncbi:cell division protein FtsQ/DivIB [Falsirhodobacter algicola]|uniref:Cell division protein FtsQ n=1 Tax=Falsirhodobacter algicola TaxID=2692330 RepID=A0A8J8MUU1_9RHOB|nr:cell division protein FtsQ/DivIB [Falsirhodobacter algicola]QUS36831.1 cell division protein FtsQ [Falsirhodobacter algicola]
MNRPPRRDPAPSLLAYRLQRMMLTPLYRRLFRLGLPFVVLGLVLLMVLGSADRRAAIAASFTQLREAVEDRPEFMVHALSIENASPQLAETIRRMLDLHLPQSSFDLDLPGMRDRIMTLTPVENVDLRVLAGGLLQADVTERVPVVVWRSSANTELLDAEGHRVLLIAERNDRADLPLITGRGANDAVPEVLTLIGAAQPIMPRVRGFVRMGERRWDIVLDRGQRIMLPVTDPVPALERILALDKADDLLARDVTVIDFRLKNRPVLRLAPNAVAERARARGKTASGGAP